MRQVTRWKWLCALLSLFASLSVLDATASAQEIACVVGCDVSFATQVSVPLAPRLGDFDGDAKSDITVFRPSTGGWHVLKSSTNYTSSFVVSWGLSTDVPINKRP